MAAMFSNHQQRFIPHNSNQSLSSSFIPFVDDYETLILQQQKKKPRLASWGCGDGFFNKFGDIRYYPNQSFVSQVSPFYGEQETLISGQNTKKLRLASSLWSVDESLDELSVIFKRPTPISSTSTAGVSKPPPEVIVIDDDEEEEIVAVSKKSDLNGKESSSIRYNEEDSANVVIDSEKENNNGGDGGFGHVSLDHMVVTVEDLKNIPWEAFDPNWEIKSAIMDPWLGPYIQQLTDS